MIKAHSTLSNNFLHTLNINKHDSWDITKPKLVLDHSYTITYPTTSLTEDYKNRLTSDIIEEVPMAVVALQTDPKLNMAQVAGLLYLTLVQKPSQSIPSKLKTTVLSSRPKRQPSSMLQKSSSPSTTNNKQITFWSDSLSALQALSNKLNNKKSINDCHKALSKLTDENKYILNG